nr:hypothetical protein CFP56_71249 [Quercus suber]
MRQHASAHSLPSISPGQEPASSEQDSSSFAIKPQVLQRKKTTRLTSSRLSFREPTGVPAYARDVDFHTHKPDVQVSSVER